MDDDIAIVGIGCRFPGADDIDQFWRVLVNGENHVVDIPPERWNNEAFYSENKDEPGKHYVKKAGFISNPHEWDNRLFGVSDNEAARVDPQQRYVLECTHMALEDAGFTRKQMAGSQTGVYIGVMNDDYKVLTSSDLDDASNYSATGMSTTIIASRVSFVYNLQGPCMVIDTACSSSMIAIHLGCQAIRTGDCEMAVCGGVSSIVSPDTFIALCRARMMSATGQCQTFCDTADGYARGEGCGVVILKSYKQAVSDGNKIWGILKTASNQDGREAQPLTAPSGEQQEELLRKIYRQYDIDPAELQYIECHGTGTPIGDPTEANAIGRFITRSKSKFYETTGDDVQSSNSDSGQHSGVDDTDSLNSNASSSTEGQADPIHKESDSDKLNPGRHQATDDKKTKILIGSVKTNIGHTESAAGVAALIKVLLMMKNGKLVPSLHIHKDKSNLNKKIKLDEYNLDIAVDVSEWPVNEDGNRICCVNSFGFGGSNSHAIVIQSENPTKTVDKSDTEDTDICTKVICMSGVDKQSLQATLEKAGQDLDENDVDLKDVSYTSVFHRDHYPFRTLVYGHDKAEILKQLQMKIKTVDKLEAVKSKKIIFVFCGVGTTWKGMCREMMDTEPLFKSIIQTIDGHLEPLAGWKMEEKFSCDTDYSDPFLNHIAIFCVQVALATMWNHWGVVPDVVVGQSVGEVAAAYISGAISLQDAVQVIYYRSKILADVKGGKMMVAGNYPIEKLEELCDHYESKVAIAVYNSRLSCTLSGDADAIDKVKAELENLNEVEREDIMIRQLSVQCAYHSHHVEPCMDVIEEQLRSIKKGTRIIKHISTVTGELAHNDDFQTGRYWAENIRKPVKFKDAILKAADVDVTNIYVEIGPRQVLKAHLQNILTENNTVGICVPSMNFQKECTSMYGSLSTLYELGADINWPELVHQSASNVQIPRCAFNKTKTFYIPDSAQQRLNGVTRNSETHMYVRRNGNSKAEFRIQIDKETTPFVFEHFFLNSLLVPGATYVEAAFEVGVMKTSYSAHELSISTEFVNPFTPNEDKQYTIDIELTDDDNAGSLNYFAKSDNGRLLCHGKITRRMFTERAKIDITPLRSRCTVHKSKEESYECLDRIDFKYGETLSLIEQSWSNDKECLVEFVLPGSVKEETKQTHLHPSVIDAMFQTFGILSTIGAEGPTLPKGLDSIVINRPPQSFMYGYSQMVKATPVGNHYNSLLLTKEGYVIAEIKNFYTKTLRISDAPNQSIVYGMQWNKIQSQENDSTPTAEDKITQCVVFGSSRFNTCMEMINPDKNTMYEMNDDLAGTEAMIRLALEQMPTMKSIIFGYCHNVQCLTDTENNAVYKISKTSFMLLALLIKVLREGNYTLPIFVITEDVKAAPSINKSATNVCGAELWGMVRSAMGETAYNDIRIVDMSLNEENAKALLDVTSEHFGNHNEYIIHKGTVYHSEMIEAPDQDIEPNQREIDYEKSDQFILKSTSPAVVTNTHFQFRNKQKELNKQGHCSVRISSICLHDSSIYPISTVPDDAKTTIWPENDDNGFDVICLEGRGWLEESGKNLNHNATPEIGFCYPVDVTNIVSIPPKCTFNTSHIPAYTPGLMTVGVLLLNIVEACRHASTVHVITEDSIHVGIQLLKNVFSKNKKTVVTVDTIDEFSCTEDEPFAAANVQCVVILSTITHDHVKKLKTRFTGLQKIVSLDEFFPRYMQRWTQHNIKDLTVTVLKTEKLFTHAELVEKVPKVYRWIKIFDNNMKNVLKQVSDTEDCLKGDQYIFSLPYPTMSLHKDKCSKDRIPLMVFRTEVFRPNGCYLLVGGLTGLGWELLQVMAELGAGFIATLSRRPPTHEKTLDIKNIQDQYGCRVIPVQADITKLEELTKTLSNLQTQIGDAKIRGVFHGGGVVCDMLLSNMTSDDAGKPLQPKILGTWNLHIATKDMPLDFFVLHSSIVSILGNPGQCNYAAGNSFQDSFANYRRNIGLCAQSINWSTLSLGMATEKKELEQNFRSQGFFYLSAEDVRSCFLRAIMTNPPQVTFGIFDWGRLEFHPTVKMYPYKFASLLDKYSTKNNGFRKMDSKYNFDIEEFNKQDAEGQRNMVAELLKKMITDTFVTDESSLTDDTKFVSLGIDSMAAMSFTNSIFETIQVRIPVVTLLSDSTTIESLTKYIVENIHNGTTGDKAVLLEQEDISKLLAFLNGNVTFMQKSLLNDYVKNPRSKNFIRQADYEVTGLKLKINDWKVMLKHLLKMNPELRRIYKINKEDQVYESTLLPADECDVNIENVPFESICNENTTDVRDKEFFDLSKDLPIRFKIACKKNKTRMRLYVHSVISDLSGVAMLFRDIGSYMKPYICNEELPEKDLNVIPADAVRKALTPRISNMRQYWRHQLQQDVHPFTFGNNIDEVLDETNWYQIKEQCPDHFVDKVLDFTQKGSMTLYNFVLSAYMALLYKKTGLELIPLVTNIDMRGHVHQLRDFVTRCINAIPIIGDLRNVGTVSEYIKQTSDRLNHMTLQSGYPYKLIEDEMQTEELRRHIGRHRIVMDNMANMNQTLKHKRVTIKLSNVFHTRYVYETTLYILYDLQQRKMSFEYGYNSHFVNHADAVVVPGELMELMSAFAELQVTPVMDILDEKIDLSHLNLAPGLNKNGLTIEDADRCSRKTRDATKGRTSIEAGGDFHPEIEEKIRRSISGEDDGSGPGTGIVVLSEDWFLKETQDGWYHDVFVQLCLDTTLQCPGELVLRWANKQHAQRKRTLYLDTVSEVTVKKMNAMYGILLRTSNRCIVLKTPKESTALNWLTSIRSANHETNNIRRNSIAQLDVHL